MLAASGVNISASVMQASRLRALRERARRSTTAPRAGFREAGLPAEARDVAVGLPGLELPGIDHLLPLGQEEVRAEPVLADLRAAASCSSSEPGSRSANCGCPKCSLVEPLADCRRCEYTSMRSASRGSLPISRLQLESAATLASVSEKVVSSTRASGFVRARWTARCRATMVLPVPAEPETRAGPL